MRLEVFGYTRHGTLATAYYESDLAPDGDVEAWITAHAMEFYSTLGYRAELDGHLVTTWVHPSVAEHLFASRSVGVS